MDRSHHHRFSVLIGDDDPAVRHTVVELVDGFGFRVFTADSGRAALHILLCEPVDFSILDVEMPEMTGIEVIRRYQRGPWIAPAASPPALHQDRRAMPTIFMSGNPSQDLRRAAREVGATFLDKPFGADDLRSAVDRILQEFLI